MPCISKDLGHQHFKLFPGLIQNTVLYKALSKTTKGWISALIPLFVNFYKPKTGLLGKSHASLILILDLLVRAVNIPPSPMVLSDIAVSAKAAVQVLLHWG